MQLILESGSMVFNRGIWGQLPTLVHIVNTLSELTPGEYTLAIWPKPVVAKTSAQRIWR